MTEKSFLHGQVSCNGISIPCQIDQTKDKHIWHLSFRPYIIGTYKIYVLHHGLPIMSECNSCDMKGKGWIFLRFAVSSASKRCERKESSFRFDG
jgi:hypothetical protein